MKLTPLNALHKALGARMIPFGGWEMPVSYVDITTEHHAVRKAVGVFDLCHMGRYRVKGKDALRLVSRTQTFDAPSLLPGRTRYALFLTEAGTVLDDILISREEDGFLLVVNAGNREPDMELLQREAKGLDVSVIDDSERIAMVAVQGPKAVEVVSRLGLPGAAAVGYYKFATFPSDFGSVLVSRTGYTGEDGFELLVDAPKAAAVFQAALEVGKSQGAIPCGLGARDTLRLEAGMPLYGHEMDTTVSPFEAGLGSAVRSSADFVGRTAALAVQAAGPRRTLVGFHVEGPSIPRQGCPVTLAGREVGVVCSGTRSPTLERNIATALIETPVATNPGPFTVVIRRHEARAIPTPLPFYRRPKA